MWKAIEIAIALLGPAIGDDNDVEKQLLQGGNVNRA